MPPAGRRIGDDFVDDSDSDLSITGFDDDTSRIKGKGKGKAIDRKKKDKGKSKAKEVRSAPSSPLLPAEEIVVEAATWHKTGLGPEWLNLHAVVFAPYQDETLILGVCDSKPMPGKQHILVLGTPCRRMRQGDSRAPSRI